MAEEILTGLIIHPSNLEEVTATHWPISFSNPTPARPVIGDYVVDLTVVTSDPTDERWPIRHSWKFYVKSSDFREKFKVVNGTGPTFTLKRRK